MEPETYPTNWPHYVLASLVTVAVLFLSHRLLRRKLNLPPGPRPWPIIGNLNLMGPLPHRSIHSLSQKYGPIMQMKFGSFPVVIGTSSEFAKAILKTHDRVCSDRPKTASGKYTTYNYSDITWSPCGPYWRQARKIFLTEIFSSKHLESSEHIRVAELKIILKQVYASNGNPIHIKNLLSDYSLNVISTMALGKRYAVRNDDKKEIVAPEEFKEMLDELFLLNGVIDIGDFVPWLSFLDLQGNIKRMKAVGKKFDWFLEQVLNEHDERRHGVKDYVAKDMVDVFLQLADDPTLEVKLQRDNVKALTQDLIAGGTESSSVTVEWAFAELLKNPKILVKAMEELDTVIGRERWIEEKDIINLPYIDAILKETMRLHPVSPLLVPRVVIQDFKIDEYDVLKGTRVIVNIWSIGRDPKLWDDPNEFKPERFVGNEIDFKGQHFELLPFGAGRRMCPGYSLGIKVMQLSLTNLLQGFNWKLGSGVSKEELNMEETYGLSTPRKFSLVVVAEPRLPSHVYSL